VESLGASIPGKVWLGWVIPGSLHRLTNETKEEVKLSFIQLLNRTLCACSPNDDDTLKLFLPDIIAILKLCSADQFDELKRVCSKLKHDDFY
jgi:hypothetical protein